MVASGPGEAVENARDVHAYDVGMCQKYVRDPCWRVGSLYGSAIDAWNGARDKHSGDRNPPDGAPCYYRGGNYGHAVICVAKGTIRSTDAPSSGQVNDQDLAWPERAWGYEYLGWTGDINGVDLDLVPRGQEDDDMPLTDEEIEKIAARVNRTLGDWNADGAEQDTDGQPEMLDQRVRQIENVVRALQDDVTKILKAVT